MQNMTDYCIKYVYPDWINRDDKDLEVGFSKKHRNDLFPIGGKILIYVIEYQIIVGAYQIIGDVYEDQSHAQHPLRLPLKKIFRIEDDDPAINIQKIRFVVPNFKADQTKSYFPINEEQYNQLERMLVNKSGAH